MDGYDLQMYQNCIMKCATYNFSINARGSNIEILTSKGTVVGVFETMRDLFNFLCGFECGTARVKISNMRPITE